MTIKEDPLHVVPVFNDTGNPQDNALVNSDNPLPTSSFNNGYECTNNTTTTPLGIDGVYTGEWEDVLNYNCIIIGIKTDQDSATDGLKIEWSADGITVDDDDTFTISANRGKVFTFSPARRYMRIVYTNDGVAQTLFRLQTVLKKGGFKPSSHRIQDSIVAEDDAELVKAVLTGENPAGTFVNFQSTTKGNFKTSIEEFESDVSTNSNSQLNTSPYPVDEFGNYAHILGDNIFKGSLITIPIEHHEIHCGDSYETSHIADLGNGDVLDVLIIVPNEGLSETHPGDAQDTKQYHFKGTVSTELETTIEFFEGVSVSANGNALNVFCRNRNFTVGDTIDIYESPTVTSTGTRLVVAKLGSAKSYGGTLGRQDEFILKDNTSYILRITNNVTTSNWVSVNLDYYVHPGV